MAPAEQVDITYCEGWDPSSRAVVGVLPVAAARDRDRVGEQYAVLLGDPQHPYALIEVAWRHDYAGVWFFDQALRRAAKHEFRRLSDDRLFLLETVERRYQRDGQAEFDPVAWIRTRRYDTDGDFREQLEPAGERGGGTDTGGSAPVETLWEPVPRFGAWASLARRDRDQPAVLTLVQRPDPDAGPGRDAGARGRTSGLAPEQRPWRPPRPLAPSNLDAMFRAGTRLALPLDDEVYTVRMDVRELGRLRMPTGRLVAVDPTLIPYDHEPLVVTVAPGEYPVTLAVARWEPPPKPGPAPGRVAAARLLVRDEPVAAWELALRAGEDPRLLGDGEFYGFGVDAGMACLVDAADADRLYDIYVHVGLDEGIEVTDPGSGANGFVFASGWGDGYYPVWIGRTSARDVACFVADMLMLDDATVLP
jgi:Protein of unknown function (DUF4241)